MVKRSQAWKALEREVARELSEFGAARHNRVDYGVSWPDVDVSDFPWLAVDSKYSIHAWSHHALVGTPETGALLVTRSSNGNTSVSMPLDWLVFQMRERVPRWCAIPDATERHAWRHHTQLDEIERRYCVKGKQWTDALLVTKTARQRGCVATMRVGSFNKLLSASALTGVS